MPTSNEIVANKPLTADELREIMVSDFRAMTLRDGMLTGQIAYGRVTYKVTYELMLDNPSYPTHKGTIYSKGAPKNKPELAAIEPAGPLTNPSPAAVVVATERTRKITSPKSERVRRNMPVTIETKSPGDGRTYEKQITYDPTQMEVGPDLGYVDRDVTKETEREWKL